MIVHIAWVVLSSIGVLIQVVILLDTFVDWRMARVSKEPSIKTLALASLRRDTLLLVMQVGFLATGIISYLDIFVRPSLWGIMIGQFLLVINSLMGRYERHKITQIKEEVDAEKA